MHRRARAERQSYKLTLLGFAAGRVSGQIWVNGSPKEQATFTKIAGYVQQEDVLSAYATVAETLTFSARMRLPSGLSDSRVSAFVEEVATPNPV
jgi:ABC-type multidrug transport system ATPase subunit